MKSFKITKKIGRKNLILSILAFILVMMLTVGITYSWIEDIHQVNYNLGEDGDRIPLNIDNDIAANAVITDTSTGATNYCTDGIIDLSKYFYASGDMHLSECYSNGTDFYFPVKKSGTTGTPTNKNYRKGTYDDVNVNYLSITLKIASPAADMDFWFTGAPTFKLGSNNSDNLRCSVTTDGKTTVYSNSGTYNTVASETASSVSSKTGKSFNYASVTTDSNPVRKNNGQTCQYKLDASNHEDNYLFRVGKDRTEPLIVTFKLWLEGNGNGSAQLSEINMNITSSINVSRTITLRDYTKGDLGQADNWMSNDSAKMYLAIVNPTNTNSVYNTHYDFTSSGTGQWTTRVPVVYNDYDIVIYRCSGNFGTGNETHKGVTHWNYWDAALPTTYSYYRFTTYTKFFGTWKEDSDVSYVLFCDIINWGGDSSHDNFKPYAWAYLWNSRAEEENAGAHTGSNAAKHHNEPWPGQRMQRINRNTSEAKIYAAYYDEPFDKVVFNNNSGGAQSGDLNIKKDNTYDYVFDYVTGHWYLGDIYKSGDSDFYLHYTINGDNNNKKKAYAYYSSVDRNNYYMEFTFDSSKTYWAIVVDHGNEKGRAGNEDVFGYGEDFYIGDSKWFKIDPHDGKYYIRYNNYGSNKLYRSKNIIEY